MNFNKFIGVPRKPPLLEVSGQAYARNDLSLLRLPDRHPELVEGSGKLGYYDSTGSTLQR